jgi:hypothetical protein
MLRILAGGNGRRIADLHDLVPNGLRSVVRRGFTENSDAWLRHLGKHCAPLDEESTQEPRAGKAWSTFLCNHREAIAAMDFFTVPTLTFGVLYCLFVIAH